MTPAEITLCLIFGIIALKTIYDIGYGRGRYDEWDKRFTEKMREIHDRKEDK